MQVIDIINTLTAAKYTKVKIYVNSNGMLLEVKKGDILAQLKQIAKVNPDTQIMAKIENDNVVIN